MCDLAELVEAVAAEAVRGANLVTAGRVRVRRVADGYAAAFVTDEDGDEHFAERVPALACYRCSCDTLAPLCAHVAALRLALGEGFAAPPAAVLVEEAISRAA